MPQIATRILSVRWRVPDEPGRQPNRWTEQPLPDLPSIERALIDILPPRDLARLALRLDQFVTAEDLGLLPDDPFHLSIEDVAEAPR